MMKNEKVLQKITKEFQNNKGKSSLYCFNNDLINEIVFNVITNFRNKNPNDYILIVIDNYNTRKLIMDYLISNNCNHNINYISESYINVKYKYEYKLCITIGVNDNITILDYINNSCKFLLCILTKNIMNNRFITEVRNILPDIDLGIEKVKVDNTLTPVEEIQMSVDISDKDRIIYDKYTEYINNTIAIFNDIKQIDLCRVGNSEENISAADYCDNLARSNGWSETLDTSIEYQKKIDDIYNPSALYERAHQFYKITKQRRDLISDSDAKLKTILDICNNNADKKILIISKRGEYAAAITTYIKEHSNIKCGDFHDCIEPAIATDLEGNTIYVKSGANKGQPKIIHAQAISSSNMKLFNNGYINVLSIKNSSSDKLKIACDIMIITSPICDDIVSIKNRFVDVNFTTIPNKTYKIYCNNTFENKIISITKPRGFIKVINQNKNIDYDEKTGDIIL